MVVLRCKVAIIGDSKVGKSAITQMFHSSGKQYPKNYLLTLGADFCVKEVNIPDSDYSVELHLFDISGCDIYQNVRSKYWESSNMIALVYDITNIQSFVNCEKWLQEFQATHPHQNIKGVLIGAKKDLEEYCAVKPQDAEHFAQMHSLAHFTCSALDRRDVDAPFNFIAATYEKLFQEKIEFFTS